MDDAQDPIPAGWTRLRLGLTDCHARVVTVLEWGDWVLTCYFDIRGSPLIDYPFVVSFERDDKVALQVMVERSIGTVFMCAFRDGEHLNFGPFADWENVNAVIPAAMDLASRLGLDVPGNLPATRRK